MFLRVTSAGTEASALLEAVSVFYDILMVIYIPLHVSVLVALLVMVSDRIAWGGWWWWWL